MVILLRVWIHVQIHISQTPDTCQHVRDLHDAKCIYVAVWQPRNKWRVFNHAGRGAVLLFNLLENCHGIVLLHRRVQRV